MTEACERLRSVRHCVDGEIERKFAPVLGRNTATDIAAVVHAECTTKSILTHHADQSVLIIESLEVNIDIAVQTAHPLDSIKGTINGMVVGKDFGLCSGEQSRHFSPPRARKRGVGATS